MTPNPSPVRPGPLLHLRATYPVETAWAPPWVGDELRQARTAARDTHLAALRAIAEAAAALSQGDRSQARCQQALAASYQAAHDAYREREATMAVTMADRTDWEQATRHQRWLAVAADAELRRRHPIQPWPPLRSAEPQPTTQAKGGDATLDKPADGEEMSRRIRDLADRHQEFIGELAERQSLMIPAEDPDLADLGPAFPDWTPPSRDAILQPPLPYIQPSHDV